MRYLDSTPQFGYGDRLTIGTRNISTRQAEFDFTDVKGIRGAKTNARLIMPPMPRSQVQAMVS